MLRSVRERRKLQRNWDERWLNATKTVGFEGVRRDTSKKVALKTSPIWVQLARFGNPFPPFDFNSGMGVRDVRKSVCREIGLLGPNEQPEIPEKPAFNGHLAERVSFDKGSKEYADLKAKFGDQIQFNEEKREVQWHSDLFKDKRNLGLFSSRFAQGSFRKNSNDSWISDRITKAVCFLSPFLNPQDYMQRQRPNDKFSLKFLYMAI